MRRRRSLAQEPRPFGGVVAASGPLPHPAFFFYGVGEGTRKAATHSRGGRGTPAGLRPDCDADPDSNDYNVYSIVPVLTYPLSLSLVSPTAGSEEQLQGGSLPHAGYGGGTTTRRMVRGEHRRGCEQQ